MAKKNNEVEEVVEVTETVENKNTEIVATEEPKEGVMTKLKRGIKKHGPKVAKVVIAGAATVAAFALGVKVGKGKANEDDDIVDTDYEVLDDENDSFVIDPNPENE